MTLSIYWGDTDLDLEVKADIYNSILEGVRKNGEKIDLERVNRLLSGLDEVEENFGDFNESDRQIRFFEVNDTPYCQSDIYMVNNGDCAVQLPERRFDYLIADRSETELVKFVPVAEVVAPVQYKPQKNHNSN